MVLLLAPSIRVLRRSVVDLNPPLLNSLPGSGNVSWIRDCAVDELTSKLNIGLHSNI